MLARVCFLGMFLIYLATAELYCIYDMRTLDGLICKLLEVHPMYALSIPKKTDARLCGSKGRAYHRFKMMQTRNMEFVIDGILPACSGSLSVFNHLRQGTSAYFWLDEGWSTQACARLMADSTALLKVVTLLGLHLSVSMIMSPSAKPDGTREQL